MSDDDYGYTEDLIRTADDHLRRARALLREAALLIEAG